MRKKSTLYGNGVKASLCLKLDCSTNANDIIQHTLQHETLDFFLSKEVLIYFSVFECKIK